MSNFSTQFGNMKMFEEAVDALEDLREAYYAVDHDLLYEIFIKTLNRYEEAEDKDDFYECLDIAVKAIQARIDSYKDQAFKALKLIKQNESIHT